MKRFAFLSFNLILMINLALFVVDNSFALAEEWTPQDKLSRGLNNMATGWQELPATVEKTNQKIGLIEALTTGIARGAGLAIARTGAGIYETATSPFAIPENYDPVMRPITVQHAEKVTEVRTNQSKATEKDKVVQRPKKPLRVHRTPPSPEVIQRSRSHGSNIIPKRNSELNPTLK